MKKNLIVITLNIIILFLVSGIFIVQPANAAILSNSSFDIDTDGWTGTGSAFSLENSGGNPGGYMQFNNNISGGYTFPGITAPTDYLGNWLSLNVTDLFYDAKVFVTGSYVRRGSYKVLISGPGGEARWNGPMVSSKATDWLALNAQIIETDWTINSGSWNAILADVASLQISMAYYTNTSSFEITGIDNVVLSSSTVPVPSTMFLLGSALIGLAGIRRFKKE